MTQELRIRQVFSSTLNIDIGLVVDDLRYNTISQWDSVAHMALVAALEEAFGIMFDTQDVLDMNSFAKAKSILQKYGVQ